MDYEKAYKEALERAKEINNEHRAQPFDVMTKVFSELKESGDEKIRKELLNHLKEASYGKTLVVSTLDYKRWADWFEKQGEDKEINNFDVLPGLYKCVHRMFDGTPNGKLLFEVDNIYKCLSKHDRAEFEVSYGHSVYLEDPVVCKHFIPFENQGEQKPINDTDEDISILDKVEPKFHEGEWLCENEPNNYARFIQILETVNVQGKERYRISRDIHNDEDIVEFNFVEKYYHKFSIQDAKDGDVLQLGNVTAIFKEFLGNNRCTCYCSVCKGEFEIPIENGDDNVYGCYNDTTPATKEQRDFLFQKIKEAGYEWETDKKELKIIDWSKHIKYDPNGPSIFTKKSTWSEEDERMCNSSIRACQYMVEHFENSIKDYEDSIEWLKSLKDRYTWKPSDEQIQALQYQVYSTYKGSWQYKASKELLEQLKKLLL